MPFRLIMFMDAEQSKSWIRPPFSQLLKTVVEMSVATEIWSEQMFHSDCACRCSKHLWKLTWAFELESSVPPSDPGVGGEAGGGCRVKPLLVHHQENQRARRRLLETHLPHVWKNLAPYPGVSGVVSLCWPSRRAARRTKLQLQDSPYVQYHLLQTRLQTNIPCKSHLCHQRWPC